MSKIVEILKKYDINGFDKNGGTDKATDHSYDVFYDQIFEDKKNKSLTVMEIGVQYGGSALLWQEFFPNSKFVFVDNVNIIHNKILSLLDNSRYDLLIEDAFKESFIEKLKLNYNDGFDVIIEDGPHTLESQKFAIKHYSSLLKKDGLLIIEDIQNYDYCETIINEIDKKDFNSIEIVDLRNNKNRYDDILIVVKK